MRTLVVSDLHLGSAGAHDVLREAHARERLRAAIAEADRLVLLGDTLELREHPLDETLRIAGPILDDLGSAAAGKPVLVLPGNHDHELAAAWFEQLRFRGEARELGLEQRVTPEQSSPLMSWLAERMPEARLQLAYPGVFLRPDVYAMHGHYLDVHLTTPRPESVIASVISRLARGPGAPFERPSHYEDALAPMYALFYRIAQGADARSLARGRGASRHVYSVANGRGAGAFLLGRVAVPGAVWGLNRAGVGPFRSDLSGEELRRSGLRSISQVIRRLGVEAEHLIFGHTHRAGPFPDDGPAEWSPDGGPRLWNTGSWFLEPVLTRGGRDSPYWPGGCVWLGDEGPPEPANLLR